MLRIQDYNRELEDPAHFFDDSMANEMEGPSVLPKSELVVTDEENRVLSIGYILEGPENEEMRFLHLCFKCTDDERGVEAAGLMVDTLLLRFRQEKEKDPGRKLILRTWANQKAKHYLDFLGDFGFRKKAKMFSMESESVMGAVEFSSERFSDGIFRESDEVYYKFESPNLLEDRDLFEDYTRLNEEAFGIPDGLSGMQYRMETLKARVFLILRYDEKNRTREIVSALSTWEEKPAVATTEDVFTSKKYQKKGFMTELFNYVLWLLHREGTQLTILNVYSDDIEGLRLYKKFGYEQKKVLLEMQVE